MCTADRETHFYFWNLPVQLWVICGLRRSHVNTHTHTHALQRYLKTKMFPSALTTLLHPAKFISCHIPVFSVHFWVKFTFQQVDGNSIGVNGSHDTSTAICTSTNHRAASGYRGRSQAYCLRSAPRREATPRT